MLNLKFYGVVIVKKRGEKLFFRMVNLVKIYKQKKKIAIFYDWLNLKLQQ